MYNNDVWRVLQGPARGKVYNYKEYRRYLNMELGAIFYDFLPLTPWWLWLYELLVDLHTTVHYTVQ